MQHESNLTSTFFCCFACLIVLMFCCVSLSLLVIRSCWQLLGLSNCQDVMLVCPVIGLSWCFFVQKIKLFCRQVAKLLGCPADRLSDVGWTIQWNLFGIKHFYQKCWIVRVFAICLLVFCLCIFLFSFWYPVCWLCAHVLLCPPQYEVLFDFKLMLTKPHWEKGSHCHINFTTC